MLLMSSSMFDGLPTPAPAEQADLAALGDAQQVDDLDARDQQVLAAGLLLERGRRPVNRQVIPWLATGPGCPAAHPARP